jgi:oxygen-independent coproporphyrinogen-3 oxidase
MAGIYVHVPFCKQACHYCNFHFSTSLNLKNGFLRALLKEIEIRKDYIGNEEVKTVYFGGGTPSLLSSDDLKTIMDALHSSFRINPDAEVTFESNPDDINPASLQTWKENAVNRLSIGIQSFFKTDLEWMNRAHNEVQAKDCVLMAHDAGFHNISIDLIYGTPSLPDEKWMTNMQTAISLNIPHLSCYALTVETGTALSTFIRKSQIADVNADDQARQFLMMTDFLAANGYEHYEISNFALPGKRSQHNSSYWSGAKYIGLGPSAHSFDGTSRQWNVANNALYIKALNDNKVPFEQETLSDSQRFNEYIMTSLRTMEGTDINKARGIFRGQASDDLLKHSEKFIERGWMQEHSNRLVLTREGKLFADGIASELFEIA